MKPDPSSSAPPPHLEPRPELSGAPLAVPAQMLPLGKNALRASLIYFFAAAIACAGEIYLAAQTRAWQVFVVAGVGGALTIVAGISVWLVRQRRPRPGIRLLIGASLASVLAAPLLVAGFGLILGFGVILVVLTIALQTLPQKEANWVLLISVAVGVVAGGLDLLSPPTQLTLPEFQNLILILGGLMVVASGGLMLRQFRDYPLTTKLILAFFAVSLAPIGILAYVNLRSIRAALIEDARQSLFSAASNTATDIDAFINDNLRTIRTEAQLPVLADYLNLPPNAQANSPQEAAVIATLRELGRKDKVFIDSYALLNSQGQNIADTIPDNIGRDESNRSYFQKPLETGLPYVSPVEFDAAANRAAPNQAGLYFSSPVRNLAGETIGVLRARYKPNILQRLVVQNNNLVGQNSFAILFDENYVRLAHGTTPELIFRPVSPLPPDQLSRLQSERRLPPQTGQQSPPANLSDLAAGLDNAIFEPYFTTRLADTGDKPNLVVVAELETQPWLVLFAQPEEVFLAPIQAQTRTTLFLAIAIAGLVTVSAFAMGQVLAQPLVHLTNVVTQFTAGNLDARAALKAGDESGVLAASFNAMAAQVGKLLKNLAERTRQLENEIGERRRAETDLQTSEEKYRRLFEDSRDVIFITARDGRIIDINPRAAILFGYSIAELKQMNTRDLYVEPEQYLKFRQIIQERGSIRDFEAQFWRKDQSVRDCLITATLWRDDDDQIVGYQGIIRDITEQKQVEKEHLRLIAIEQELRLAQEIQQSLLPPAQPRWDGPSVVCFSTPAREMGGDLYAYHAFPVLNGQRKYALTVGDVSGKGMPAALLMAVSVASFQAVVGQELTPSALLTHLDQAIAPYTKETGQNCALVYAEIILNSHRSGHICVANAGCMMPLIRRANGSVMWVEAFGTPLGMNLSADFGYREFDLPISKGDLVILTSDGVVEAMTPAGEIFGLERLEQTVAAAPSTGAEEMLAHIRAKVARFAGETEPHDDMTIVVMQI